jgi:hypothetical protein
MDGEGTDVSISASVPDGRVMRITSVLPIPQRNELQRALR